MKTEYYERKAMDAALKIVVSKQKGINEYKKNVIPYLMQFYLKTEEYEKCEMLKTASEYLEKQKS